MTGASQNQMAIADSSLIIIFNDGRGRQRELSVKMYNMEHLTILVCYVGTNTSLQVALSSSLNRQVDLCWRTPYAGE